MFKMLTILLMILIALSGCEEMKKSLAGNSDKVEQESSGGGMKCGAGKCGANMFDGNAALAKKQRNILSQMRENDPRKTCVLSAKSAKELYDCVRNKDSGKMSLKCGDGKCGTAQNTAAMKCGAGKCGSASVPMPKKEPAMKCGAGKCGSGM